MTDDQLPMRDRPPHPVIETIKRVGPVLFGLGLFALGIFALYHLLAPVKIADVVAQMRATSPAHLAAALAATFAGYVALMGYDWSALHYLKKPMPLRVIAVGGFLGYSFGNTIGIGAVSGGAVRYRIYSAFGLNAYEVAAVSTFVSLAFGLGISIIGLSALVVHPHALGAMISASPVHVRLVAGGLVVTVLAVLGWLSLSGRSVTIRGVELRAPSPEILLGQLLFSAVDTVMAALTLYVLLPAGAPDFFTFLAVFAAATMAGVISHVPGGIGVFESLIIASLPAAVPLEQAAAALLLYRMIYYLVPFALAMIFVALNEARLAGGAITRVLGESSAQMEPIRKAISSVAPAVAGTATLGLGIYLLLMSVLPSVRPDEVDPNDFVAAILLEGGTLLSSALGVLLILLAQGLFRRISGAFWLTLGALVAGAAASLLNDIDLEGAALLLLAAAVLSPLRREFYRATKLTQDMLSPGWFALLAGIGLSTLAFLFLAHASTPYSSGLWVEFSGVANTPRAFRAAVLASALVTFGMVYLALQPARTRNSAPDAGALEKVARIIAAQDDPLACLALSGDKTLFFSENEDAVIMYAVQGRSWVAYGDPIGNDEAVHDLAWAFFDAAYAANARPVFYEVSEKHLPLWIEMGLSLHKIGEEAIVPLADFSMAGSKFKSMRAAHNKALKSGLEFALCEPPHDPELIAQIRQVSNAWLGEKSGREKGFSIGRFDAAYLAHFPIAVVRREGRIIAFASVMRAGTRISIDLMRYLPAEANGMMQFLFLELIAHFRDHGATEFSLGMAPLSGLEARHGTRLWNRFGAVLFRHGGAFYNFAGLRAFKQKFQPVWRPRFLAVPGSLPPLAALRDVALLIAGGAKGLVKK